MADSQFALSYEIIVNQLKQNAKNKNTTKSTQTIIILSLKNKIHIYIFTLSCNILYIFVPRFE